MESTAIRRKLRNDLKKFDATAAGLSYDLRADLAGIILRHLDGKKWTQKKLADAAGMKPSFLTRIIHHEQNCTFDVTARILHALGVRASLAEMPAAAQETGKADARARRRGADTPRSVAKRVTRGSKMVA